MHIILMQVGGCTPDLMFSYDVQGMNMWTGVQPPSS